MTTLTVSFSTDYSATALSNITLINFTRAGTNTATFLATQFDDTQISTAVTLDGSTGSDRIVINGANQFSAEHWTFVNWGAGDLITVNGTVGDDWIVGSTQTDVLNGGFGNDTLVNDFGSDSMYGGDGDDLVVVGLGEADGGLGSDICQVLGNISFTAVVVDIGDGGGGRDIGNGLRLSGFEALYLFGSSGADRASGAALADTMDGGGGSDWFLGRGGNDQLFGGTGASILFGGAGGDVLRGHSAADTLSGGNGNDILIGGMAVDRMTGGAGADRFMFQTMADSGLGVARDVITDFTAGLDMIDLSGIDADPTTSAIDTFTYIGQTSFFPFGAAQVRFYQAWGNSVIQVQEGGSSGVTIEIMLIGLHQLTLSDFIL